MDGNLTNDGTQSYSYDEENRLTAAGTSSYIYDAFNRRVGKTVGTATYYIHDRDHVIEERNSSGTLVADYTYGPLMDETLTMTRSGNTYRYFYDGLGSARDIANAGGTVIESYDYDPVGKPTATSSIGNPVMFTGRWYDVESGNYYYRNRYMNPTQGRFVQRDPIGYGEGDNFLFFQMNKSSVGRNLLELGDGMNLYTSVHNNFVNYTDPLGLKSASLDPRVQACEAEVFRLALFCGYFHPHDEECWEKVKDKADECRDVADQVIKTPDPHKDDDGCDHSGSLEHPGKI